MTSPDAIRRLLTDQIERLWGRGELDIVRRNYCPDVIDHMPISGQASGLDAMAAVVTLFRGMIPDMALTLHGTIVDGDHGCDWWTLTGTRVGRAVRFSGIDLILARDGRIAELWHVEDMRRFEAQSAGEAVADFDLDDLRAAAPDIAIVDEARLAKGALSVRRFRLTGTHTAAPLMAVPAGGQSFSISGMEIRDGDTRVLQVIELAQLRAQIA